MMLNHLGTCATVTYLLAQLHSLLQDPPFFFIII